MKVINLKKKEADIYRNKFNGQVFVHTTFGNYDKEYEITQNENIHTLSNIKLFKNGLSLNINTTISNNVI